MKLFQVFLSIFLSFLFISSAKADFIDHFANKNDVGKNKIPRFGQPNILVVPVEIKGNYKDKKGALNPLPALDQKVVQSLFDNHFSKYFEVNSGKTYKPKATVVPKITMDCPTELLLANASKDLLAKLKNPDSASKAELDSAGIKDCRLIRGDTKTFKPATKLYEKIFSKINERVKAGSLDIKKFDTLGSDFRESKADGFSDGAIFILNLPHYGIAFPYGFKKEVLFGNAFFNDPAEIGSVKYPSVAVASSIKTDTAAYMALHEFAHLLGAVDLYNEENGKRLDANLFSRDIPLSLMGGYAYNTKIPMMLGFTRYMMGWGKPLSILGDKITTDLAPAEKTSDIIVLGNAKDLDQIFIIENRQAGNYDTELKDEKTKANNGGVLITKINLKKLPNAQSGRFIDHLLKCVNCDPKNPLISVMEADGKQDMLDPKKNVDPIKSDTFNPKLDLLREGSAALSLKFDGEKQVAYKVKVISKKADGTYKLEIENLKKVNLDCSNFYCGYKQACKSSGSMIGCQTSDDKTDADKDGFSVSQMDCDDNNPNINYLKKETPYNKIDDDCNPFTKDNDLDNDGKLKAGDCDDLNPRIFEKCKDFNTKVPETKLPSETLPQNESGCNLNTVNPISKFALLILFSSFFYFLLLRKKQIKKVL